MLKITCEGVYYKNGGFVPAKDGPAAGLPAPEKAREGTMAHAILKAHNTGDNMEELAIRFDAMASHDITYVGIIQTARASGMQAFPLPYVLTNCHNSLCAVGGTINEDDHVFGLSAAKKYGGEFVPAHQSVIHSYMRERYAAPGRMILGSDSHTRYGAYGTMAIGEGGPELARQLLSKTYNIPYPKVIAIYLTGTPIPGVGPQDVALELIRSTFKDGVVKNAVMEFFGPGVANLSMDYRSGIDVMTTETTCLSSIWPADHTLKAHLAVLGRGEAFKPQAPADGAYYDGLIEVELDKIRPMIALPFHPSNAYTIKEFKENMDELLHQVDEDTVRQLKLKNRPASLREKIVDGKFRVDQGVIAGCSGGTYQNIVRAAQILDGRAIGSGEFWLSVYPTSQPVNLELTRRGYIASLMAAGASIRSCFCGPCFGAGDVPANGAFSIRHSTRNFPNREGSKPSDGQVSYVALMDARSIAATAANAGRLTPATDLDWDKINPDLTYHFDANIYKERCYQGWGRADSSVELKYGPNITDWPAMAALPENLLLRVACVITDPVTTTDELIPSGETSSLRSNPLKLAEFALSRKDPEYVGRAKDVFAFEKKREADPADASVLQAVRKALAPLEKSDRALFDAICGGKDLAGTGIGSTIFAMKPGDGSAREQAASSQKVLGGWANLALEYATKRYRSNLINWGMLPFLCEPGIEKTIANGDFILVPGIRSAVKEKKEVIPALFIHDGSVSALSLKLGDLTDDERRIILDGCLINFYNEK